MIKFELNPTRRKVNNTIPIKALIRFEMGNIIQASICLEHNIKRYVHNFPYATIPFGRRLNQTAFVRTILSPIRLVESQKSRHPMNKELTTKVQPVGQ